uniref:Uncharacterized protein n=1 Tax=Rhizophora mucronata TaxID=61149 RepID=A0A2P2IHR5_RHIMU
MSNELISLMSAHGALAWFPFYSYFRMTKLPSLS